MIPRASQSTPLLGVGPELYSEIGTPYGLDFQVIARHKQFWMPRCSAHLIFVGLKTPDNERMLEKLYAYGVSFYDVLIVDSSTCGVLQFYRFFDAVFSPEYSSIFRSANPLNPVKKECIEFIDRHCLTYLWT